MFMRYRRKGGWVGIVVNSQRADVVANHPTPAAVSLPKNAALGVSSRAANAVVLVVGIK